MPGGTGKTNVFGDTIYDLIYQMIKQEMQGFALDGKLNLGGADGEDGGEGEPPKGFSGQLAQRFVAYDTSERERMGLLAYSGWENSLVDNLNHVRYWEKASKWFQPHFNGTYEVEVYGGMYWIDSDTYLDFQGDEITVTAPSAIGPRIDVIYIDTTGTLYVSTGTPVASGVPAPTYPSLSHLPVCELYMKESGAAGVTAGVSYEYASGTYQGYLYKDVRPFFGQNTALGDVEYLGDLLDVSDIVPDPRDVLGYDDDLGLWRPMAWLNAGLGGGQPTLQVDGPLSTIEHVGGAYICTRSGYINSVYLYCETPGISGSTIIDVNKDGTTIFTDQDDRPTLLWDDANQIQKVILASGITVVDETLITVDIDQVATEAANLTTVVALNIDVSETHPLSGDNSPHTGVLAITDLQDGSYSGYPLLSRGDFPDGSPAYSLLTSLGIASNAVTYSKLGPGALKANYRQGGSGTNWQQGGTTNYDITDVNMKVQMGVINVTATPYTPTAFTVTFPEAYTQLPIVLISARSAPIPTVYVDTKAKIQNVTVSEFVGYAIGETGATENIAIDWIAIGEE